MSSALDLLSTQHADVLVQLTLTETTLASRDLCDLSSFTAYLQHEVTQHFTVEEEALFPLLEIHLGRERGPLAVMHIEHAEFRTKVAALVAARNIGDFTAQRAIAHEIIALLRSHIAKEDHVLLPMAMRVLSREELTQLDARAATKDRPHTP